MTSEEFITGIRKAVYEPAVDGALLLIGKPPGRRPAASLIALSEWFNRLTPVDKERIRGVIGLAARQAVFGMLAVLDGVRSIAEDGQPGSLELRYIRPGEVAVLNGPAGVPLHELFAGQVPPPWGEDL